MGGVPAWVMWVVYVYVFTCVLFRLGVISQITIKINESINQYDMMIVAQSRI